MLDTPLPPTSIFDPERVDCIGIHAGKIYPWQHNRKPCICQRCRRESVPAGAAVRFLSARNTHNKTSGYYCEACVAAELETGTWHWNSIEETLFPAQPLTIRPIDGLKLAAAFRTGGERGLFYAVIDR